MSETKTASDVIYQYLASVWGMNEPEENLLKWFGEDEIVSWFVNGFFVRDDHDLRSSLSAEDYDIVMEHYNLHCKG